LSAASKSATVGEKDDEGASTMSATAAMQRRVDDVIARADDVLRRRLERERDQLEREDAAQRRADAAKAREDADECRRVAEKYDGSFRGFGVETPQARDGEDPQSFRHRLFRRLLRRLPDDHELQGVEPSELPEIALDNLEQLLIGETAREAASPSEANLPSDGSMIMRTRVDSDTGEKQIHWHGKRSFIADLGRQGRRVRAIVDRNSGQAIWGRIG
jgi:hypothetical protein